MTDREQTRVAHPAGHRRLKIGVQLPEVEYVASWHDYRVMAQTAEAIGLDSIWLGDHLLYRYPGEAARGPWECLSLLAALAAATERVELGPLVLCTGFRNPALVAKMAETIDEISGGRLILGLGAGWHRPEYDAFGYPFDRRVDRFADAFTVLRTLMRDGQASFDGEFAAVSECEIIPRGPRPGKIPLMIGSSGERMLRLTLPWVDQWNIWYADFGNQVAGLIPRMARVDAICQEIGRDPAEIERTAAVLVQAPGGSFRATGAAGERAVAGISGSPAEVAAALREFYLAGISHLQLVLDPVTPASISWLEPVLDLLRAERT